MYKELEEIIDNLVHNGRLSMVEARTIMSLVDAMINESASWLRD